MLRVWHQFSGSFKDFDFYCLHHLSVTNRSTLRFADDGRDAWPIVDAELGNVHVTGIRLAVIIVKRLFKRQDVVLVVDQVGCPTEAAVLQLALELAATVSRWWASCRRRVGNFHHHVALWATFLNVDPVVAGQVGRIVGLMFVLGVVVVGQQQQQD